MITYLHGFCQGEGKGSVGPLQRFIILSDLCGHHYAPFLQKLLIPCIIHIEHIFGDAVYTKIFHPLIIIRDRTNSDRTCFTLFSCFREILIRCFLSNRLIYLRIKEGIISFLVIYTLVKTFRFQIFLREDMMNISAINQVPDQNIIRKESCKQKSIGREQNSQKIHDVNS